MIRKKQSHRPPHRPKTRPVEESWKAHEEFRNEQAIPSMDKSEYREKLKAEKNKVKI